jgi:hypothetical protein
MGGSGGTATCETPCGDDCCESGASCFDDGLGNTACAAACESNSDCPVATPICTLFDDGTSGCTVDLGGLQRCKVAADCTTEACAPDVDSNGDPVGPYVCVPNDGGDYHGCFGALTSCGGGFCCFTDAQQNQFCARPCSGDNECGNAQCVTFDNSNTTCSETTGCGI